MINRRSWPSLLKIQSFWWKLSVRSSPTWPCPSRRRYLIVFLLFLFSVALLPASLSFQALGDLFLCFLLCFVSVVPLQCSPAFQVKENKEKERLERRLLEELYKVFMDSDSFYYSTTYDLTNSVQRQGDSDKSGLPLWKQVGGVRGGPRPVFVCVCENSSLYPFVLTGGRSFLLEQTHDPRPHWPPGDFTSTQHVNMNIIYPNYLFEPLFWRWWNAFIYLLFKLRV